MTAIMTTYITTFPPPVSNHLHLSASSSALMYTPPPDTFHSFPLLPFELQHQIWTEAAKQWVREYLERVNTWNIITTEKSNQTANKENNSNEQGNAAIESSSSSSSSKRIFLIHITSNPRYRRQSPNLLWTCTASRTVLYSSLLAFKSDSKVQNGNDVQLFMRRCAIPTMGLSKPSSYGVKVHNFRIAGLQQKIEQEHSRLERMGWELREVKEGRMVDPEDALKGYVRLPLLNGVGSVFREDGAEDGRWKVMHLYPRVDMNG